MPSPAAPPTNVVATPVSTSRVLVTWNAVPNAIKYYVTVSVNGGAYSFLGTSTTTSFTAANLQPGTNYCFEVADVTASRAVLAVQGPQARKLLSAVNGDAAAVARFDVAQGKVSIIGRGDCERRWIATEDVAALVAAVTLEVNAPEVVEVGGPESISKNRLVELAERTSGRRIKTQHMPRQLARIVIALAARFNDALASALGAGLQQDLLQASWDDTPLRERGIQPQSASDYVTRIAKGTR